MNTISKTFQQEIAKEVLSYVVEPVVKLSFVNDEPYFYQLAKGEISDEQNNILKNTLEIPSDPPCGILINENEFWFDDYKFGGYAEREIFSGGNTKICIINFTNKTIEIISIYGICCKFKMSERETILLRSEFKKYKLL